MFDWKVSLYLVRTTSQLALAYHLEDSLSLLPHAIMYYYNSKIATHKRMANNINRGPASHSVGYNEREPETDKLVQKENDEAAEICHICAYSGVLFESSTTRTYRNILWVHFELHLQSGQSVTRNLRQYACQLA